MCGIVGILFRRMNNDLGSILVDMMKRLQHRGKDGAGVAIYGSQDLDEDEYSLKLEILGERDDRVSMIKEVEDEIIKFGKINNIDLLREGSDFAIIDVKVKGLSFAQLKRLALNLQSLNNVSVLSAGKFEIFKDVGYITHVDEAYGISKKAGTHGIGHIRFSTESGVDRYHAHPFQSFLYPDIAVVHNGQITNYWNTRAKLEAKGHYFTTDNDTECIVHYVADKLLEGFSLEEALESAVRDLDGPFAFIISTPDEIGIAKDKLGLRPALVAEDNEVFAISSEEVALEPLGLNTEYLAPGEWRVFRK